MDGKAVYIVSNYHGTTTIIVKRKEKDEFKTVTTCLQVVKDYNESIGGVDQYDMLR